MSPNAVDPEPEAVEEPDWFLSAVLRGHRFLTKRLVMYGWLLKTWLRRGLQSKHFTPIYALAWLLAVVVVFALSPLWVGGSWALVPVLLIAGWRYVDVVLWYLGLLLNPRHTRFAPVERNVLLLIVDLVTVVFIAAILLRATDTSRSVDSSWFDGFFLVTLTDVPPRRDLGDGVAQAMALSAGLLVIAGGLALILSVVSKRLSSEGPHVGPSHSRD